MFMCAKVWPYNNTDANNYAFREMIASEKCNNGESVDDALPVDELKEALARHPQGKHLVILHTKGSHYLHLINTFDNSILYTDSFIDKVRDKKRQCSMPLTMVSQLTKNYHLHGTPRDMVPPEQFCAPMMVWALDAF
ncbi:sulfatase-like hydrolase/transferase [Sodalis sp.]|uniref:sulfatase-like hydrolase/transferase n=1 Tax=Sodalis sp. (in: enterobacteria) TaxID=1898979 RepID=UPI0038737189